MVNYISAILGKAVYDPDTQGWGTEDKKICNIAHHFSGKLTITLLVLLAIFLFVIGCFVRKRTIMSKKLIYLISFVLVLCLFQTSIANAADPSLVGWVSN